MTNGRFVTFEGGEGSGKSTQARILADRLKAHTGAEVVLTREPGGTPDAERIRDLLVNGAADRWSAIAETLLYYAARDNHLRHAIRPAVERGAWVVCDRFSDSTRAYQGGAGSVSSDLIEQLEAMIVGSGTPDLTLIIDLDPKIGLERSGRRGDGSGQRFEDKGLAFHRRLRRAYLHIAELYPNRCLIIPGQFGQDEVAASVWNAVVNRFLR